jgi:hypothetical protein
VLPAQVIALDGKTVRRSHDRVTGQQAIHMVSAWATETRLVLAQVKVDEKSTRSPPCRTSCISYPCRLRGDDRCHGLSAGDRAANPRRGGDYVLGLKGNQGRCMRMWHEVSCWHSRMRALSTARRSRSRKGMAGSRHDGAGSSAMPRF